MQLTLNRFKSNNVSTLGKLLINQGFACYICEDAYHVVKVYGQTRIPAGRYFVILKTLGSSRMDETYTKKFGDWHKGMLQIIGVPGFTGVLLHIGNKNIDTDGCLLTGSSINVPADPNASLSVNDSTHAYEKVYPQILAVLQAGEKVIIDIVDNDNPVDINQPKEGAANVS